MEPRKGVTLYGTEAESEVVRERQIVEFQATFVADAVRISAERLARIVVRLQFFMLKSCNVSLIALI